MATQKIIIQEVKKITETLVEDIRELISYLYEKPTKQTCRKWLKLLLAHPNTFLFTAKLSPRSKISGMLTLTFYPTIGGYYKTWLEDVVVSPDTRGRGIGKELVKAALSKAKKLKIKQVNLTSNPTRKIANKMYQKLNFTKYKTNYYHFFIK